MARRRYRRPTGAMVMGKRNAVLFRGRGRNAPVNVTLERGIRGHGKSKRWTIPR